MKHPVFNKSTGLSGRLALHELDRCAAVGLVGNMQADRFAAARLLILEGGLPPLAASTLQDRFLPSVPVIVSPELTAIFVSNRLFLPIKFSRSTSTSGVRP